MYYTLTRAVDPVKSGLLNSYDDDAQNPGRFGRREAFTFKLFVIQVVRHETSKN